MNPKPFLRFLVLLFLLAAFLPVLSAHARIVENPPVRFFQLPWEQGKAWVALDGFDNGFKRPRSSPHHYTNGGAVDFAPYNGIRRGVDTSRFWVTAVAAGKVTEVGWCHLKLDHGNGWTSEYQFIANILVKAGDSVYRNQKLAVIADGVRQPFCIPHVEDEIPHLHFSLRPTMRNVTFAGWLVEYVPLLNWTTFTKGGVKVGSYRPLMNLPDLLILLRQPIAWNTLYDGSVDELLYERWPLELNTSTTFTVTVTPQTNGLSLLILLLDGNGNELTRSTTGSLKTTQPAGSYFVQIQPQSGQGLYQLVAVKEESPLPAGPYVYTEPASPTIDVGQAMLTTVGLRNVPVEGFSSTEFTCTYDPALVTISQIQPTNLFGPDPAIAINGPSQGTFIVAIAGSKGNRAVTSGPAFTYLVEGIQAGETTLECRARISKGDGLLTPIEYIPAQLIIRPQTPLPTATPVNWPTPMPEPTQTPTNHLSPTSTPTQSPTPEASLTPSPGTSPTPEFTATPAASPTVSPAVPGTLTGQVQAGKPATVRLYDNNTLVAATLTNSDGTFRIQARAGFYTVVATASGYLNVQGSALLTAEQETAMPRVTLLAGDIDGNNVIDQFDALTIGMNYNAAAPGAADLNNDGTINVLDLELLAQNYRKTGPGRWR
ncbi:MAG: peptidoglycan DD-metalloendopeptidase family protein [Anaerolineales bacterium]|nr:peptidoglycan DD-metalloendopeptidase family protein [Anaerolineales bacterium]MCX7753768.1 peptidoglycan DD-metalloendopeptidase family protein [Anaerolineales bacterium]MDW8278879.1 peptidoglycan DD-metalloendopeptidase family protein [Anaerolineales bacterium]